MHEHRVTLTIGDVAGDQVERLVSGLDEVARQAGPAVGSNVGTDQVEIVLGVEAEDAASAVTEASGLLRTALTNAAFTPRQILHAEAELVGGAETAAA
jgi:hypothetical protein